MLVDGRCSIYEHRPRTCRTYDCRVFPATDVVPDQPAVAVQVKRWRFSFPSEADSDAHARVLQAAAVGGDEVRNATERAVRALASTVDGAPGRKSPGMPSKSANVKNEKQYEALKDKGMSKERAAKIANSPGASSRGGKASGSGSSKSAPSRAARLRRRRKPVARAARPPPGRPDQSAAESAPAPVAADTLRLSALERVLEQLGRARDEVDVRHPRRCQRQRMGRTRPSRSWNSACTDWTSKVKDICRGAPSWSSQTSTGSVVIPAACSSEDRASS